MTVFIFTFITYLVINDRGYRDYTLTSTLKKKSNS